MLASLGGKGANLIRLRDAGLPVPPFVVIDTQEYREFVRSYGLDTVIRTALARAGVPDRADETLDPAAPIDAAGASATIQAAFARPLPTGQRMRLATTVAELGDLPVAVRSSATAEDLPDLSFAGQQDTFLDVNGVPEVLAKVVECWASLWTERAISYRARNGIGSDGVALAVVVQAMVPAEASGVLFTADPLTGHRGHTVVDAVFGLGDALVSGQVNPDTYQLDRTSGAVRRSLAGQEPTLTDGQLVRLAELGTRIEAVFGAPQDIEWVRVGEDLSVVQSRPITSLYPLPHAAERLPVPSVWMSFGAFQGMLDPITPLGQDVIRLFLAGAARLFGHRPDYRANLFVQPAGERLWIRLDQVLRTPPGRLLARRFLPIAEPGTAAILAELAREPAFAVRGSLRSADAETGPDADADPDGPGDPRPRHAATQVAGSLRIAAGFGRRVAPYVPQTLARPELAVANLNRRAEEFVTGLAERLRTADTLADDRARLASRLDALTGAGLAIFGVLLPAFGQIFPVGLGLLALLRALGRRTGLPDADGLALAVLRGLPGNVTTQMDLRLWEVACSIRADEAAYTCFAGTDAGELTSRYVAGGLPPVAQRAVDGFLARYGMRGVAEIDIGTPRWREDPEQVLRTLAAYVTIDDPARTPDAVYERGRAEAHAALGRLATRGGGRATARQVEFLGSRIRAIMGARETPKFTMVRVLGLLREALLASGADLVAAGVLDDPREVFLLRVDELRGAFGRADLRDLVAGRAQARARELRRTRVPLVLVSDGRTFYAGHGEATSGSPGPANGLRGAGVSPGVVTGDVRIVHDPRTADLHPGEILVCRGTDPAWTPLFLAAGGLVTEVGGLMTHGSVVAREYGIPAVVGVGNATTQLRTGQCVRVDGTAGTIEVLG